MRLKEINIVIKPSPIDKFAEYSAIDMVIKIDGRELELHELVENNDFKSKFDQILDIVKKEVAKSINEWEE